MFGFMSCCSEKLAVSPVDSLAVVKVNDKQKSAEPTVDSGEPVDVSVSWSSSAEPAPCTSDSATGDPAPTAERAAAALQEEVSDLFGPCRLSAPADVFQAHSLQKFSHPLGVLAFGILQEVAAELGLPLDKIERFALALEAQMPDDNHYHNQFHVADVAQLMFLQVTDHRGPLYEDCAKDPLLKLSALIAALCHDLQHPGVNNQFLRDTAHPLVAEYGREAPSEKMHVALLKRLIDTPDMNFLEPLSSTDRTRVIQTAEAVIFATDMAKHLAFVSAPIPESAPDLQVFKLCLAIKVSDLSHTVRSFQSHKRFSKDLKQEFYAQGEKERKLGRAPSHGMNKDESPADVAAAQIAFLEMFIEPLLERWLIISGSELVAQLLELLKRNIGSWKMMLDPYNASGQPQFSDGKISTAELRSDRGKHQRSERALYTKSFKNIARAYHVTVHDVAMMKASYTDNEDYDASVCLLRPTKARLERSRRTVDNVLQASRPTVTFMEEIPRLPSR